MRWFNRKPKNRRLGRGHVLDVKLRSSQVRAARIRLTAIALGGGFAMIFGVFLLWRTGEWVVNRLVYENDAFAIKHVEVQTDGVLSLEQLRRWSGVQTNANLLSLDLARVKRDLELVPQVELVAVERVLPHTLRLRVVEREPVAQVLVPRLRPGGGLDTLILHLDSRGFVMPPVDPRMRSTPAVQPDDQLPMIAGISPVELQIGRRIESTQVAAALRLIKAFEQSPMIGLVDLHRIDVSSPEVLLVATGQGSDVTFSIHDLDRQLRRWREIYELGQRMNKAVATLDLSVPNNIPARWIEASAAPAVSPKTKTPQPNRKKNV